MPDQSTQELKRPKVEAIASKSPSPIEMRDVTKRGWADMKLSDVVMLLLTLIAVWIYYRQEAIMKGQETIMNAQIRPWVGFASVENPPLLVVGKDLVLTIVLENSGESPALDGDFCAQIRVMSMKDVTEDGLASLMNTLACRGLGSNYYILPHATKRGTLKMPAEYMTKQQVDDIEGGRTTVVAYGKIDYEDPEHNQHVTTFCVFYDDGFYSSCPSENEAD
jgi:hypothetical protein